MLKLHTQAPEEQAGEMRLSLDELAREGARRMLAAALEAEVAEYLERHRGERDEQGQALVVKNGRARARSPWARERWRFQLRGSMTAGWLRASGSASRARSCRPT
jgi:hypothetical protein